MDKAALEARRAYKRKWSKENPEKVKAYQEKYWAKKAAEMAAEEGKEKPEQIAG